MVEVWKDIKGYEGYYMVSNHSRIKSISRVVDRSNGIKYTVGDRILKHSHDVNGYAVVTLYKDKTKKVFRAHRLSAKAFIKEVEGKPFINHKDGNPNNNIISNLEWCTHPENMQHAYDIGLMSQPVGEEANYVKLKELEVIEIKGLLDKVSERKLASMYSVSRGAISAIRHGISWSHIQI